MLTQIRKILTQNLSVDNVVTRIAMAAELRMEDEYYYLLEYFSTIKKEAMESTVSKLKCMRLFNKIFTVVACVEKGKTTNDCKNS